jgi:hypothetical protein
MSDACPGCGKPGPHGKYSGPEGKRMEQTGECFMCAFWELAATKKHDCVIDGFLYTIGREPKPNSYRNDLGMGGRRFDIEFFDGRRVMTHNLWAGGLIPERFRDRIPNTARFAGGAERCQVGETTCWNPSTAAHPESEVTGG